MTTVGSSGSRNVLASLKIIGWGIAVCLFLQSFQWGYQRHRRPVLENDATSVVVHPSWEDHRVRKDNLLGGVAQSSTQMEARTRRRRRRRMIQAAQAWIHPPLLAHPNPRHVVLLWKREEEENTTRTERMKGTLSSNEQAEIYIQQAVHHKDVTHVTLIQIVPPTPAGSSSFSFERVGVQIRQLAVSVSFLNVENPWAPLQRAMEDDDDEHSNNNNNVGLPPPHLVLIDAQTTRQVTTSSPGTLLSLLEILCVENHQPMDGFKDEHHDDATMLTVVLENKGNHFQTTYNRHFIGKVLIHAQKDEQDKSWELMTDYTLRLPPLIRHLDSLEQRQEQLRNYVILFSDFTMYAHWHVNEAVWNRRIHTRLRIEDAWKGGNGDDDDDLLDGMVLDSTLLLPLMYPTKQSEVEFCRSFSPTWPGCHPGGGTGIDLTKSAIPMSQLVVQKSKQGSHAGRGLYTKIDILPNTLIGADQPMVFLDWLSTHILSAFQQRAETNPIYERLVDSLNSYIDGYGVVHEWQGMPFYLVDSTGLTFVNHGCQGTGNVGQSSRHHESNLRIPDIQLFLEQRSINQTTSAMSYENWLYSLIPNEYLFDEGDEDFFVPIRRPGSRILTESNQFIPAGSEILDNYLTFSGMHAPTFWNYVAKLQRECGGTPGDIERWERGLHEKEEEDDNLEKTNTSQSCASCLDGDCTNEL